MDARSSGMNRRVLIFAFSISYMLITVILNNFQFPARGGMEKYLFENTDVYHGGRRRARRPPFRTAAFTVKCISVAFILLSAHGSLLLGEQCRQIMLPGAGNPNHPPLSLGSYVNLSNRGILPPINPEILPCNQQYPAHFAQFKELF